MEPDNELVQEWESRLMTEKVFVFDAEHMKNFKDLPGISTNWSDLEYLKIVCKIDAYFEKRPIAESNENQKQIIPYVIIRKGNKLLAYMRSKKSGEGRLHNKWSIGVGGHINPKDAPKLNKQRKENETVNENLILSNAINRELLEELDWGDKFNYTVNNINEFGIIYDDKDAVGRVHIGYVLIIDVPEDEKEFPKPSENTISDHGWFTVKESLKLTNLEGWSSIVLEAMSSENE
jgi:predicted NUDIX family phosphoesterase